MTKKTNEKSGSITIAESIRLAKKEGHEAMKKMSAAERHQYIREQSAIGLEMLRESTGGIPEYEQRDESLLIKLTKTEKSMLERDAATENIKSVSALVRSRSLLKQSPFETILSRLDAMSQDISRIKKKLRI